MCAQIDVLKKIRKAGKMNGFAIDLAEAQAKDFMTIKRRLDGMEASFDAFQIEQARQGEIQAKQSGMIEAIFNRLNSPVEQERLDGQKWNLLISITKHKAAWVILALVVLAFAFAGERIATIIEKLL